MSQFVLVVASRAITEFMLAVLAVFFTPPARASDRSGFRAEMFSACLLARGRIVRDHQVHARGLARFSHRPHTRPIDRLNLQCFLLARLPVVLPCEIAEFVPVVPART